MDSRFVLPAVEYESQFLFNGGQRVIDIKTTFDGLNIIVVIISFLRASIYIPLITHISLH